MLAGSVYRVNRHPRFKAALRGLLRRVPRLEARLLALSARATGRGGGTVLMPGFGAVAGAESLSEPAEWILRDMRAARDARHRG